MRGEGRGGGAEQLLRFGLRRTGDGGAAIVQGTGADKQTHNTLLNTNYVRPLVCKV